MTDFPERDWRVFRELRELALERFCSRVLDEVTEISVASGKSAHQRYGEIYSLIDRRDDELARAFNGPRRSMAALQLMLIQSQGLLTPEELARFTEETRRRIEP